MYSKVEIVHVQCQSFPMSSDRLHRVTRQVYISVVVYRPEKQTELP